MTEASSDLSTLADIANILDDAISTRDEDESRTEICTEIQNVTVSLENFKPLQHTHTAVDSEQLHHIAQHFESSEIMRYKGDKRKYRLKGNKRKDKYLDGSDFFCTLPKFEDNLLVHNSLLSDSEDDNICKVTSQIYCKTSIPKCKLTHELRKIIKDGLSEQIRTRTALLYIPPEYGSYIERGFVSASMYFLSHLSSIGIVDQITDVISVSNKSTVLHATGNMLCSKFYVPKECIIKILSTFNETIEQCYALKDIPYTNIEYKNHFKEKIRSTAKKEADIMVRLDKLGINCPKLVYCDRHVLVMSFIGQRGKRVNLTEVSLKPEQWQCVYQEVVERIHKIYKDGGILYGAWNAHNTLWWQNKCWFIDFSQSVTKEHLNEGKQLFFKSCRNISEFFAEKGVPDVECGEYIFQHITGVEDWWSNTFKTYAPSLNV